MLQANVNNKDATERISRLISAAHVINCDATSQIVEFSFIRPEARNIWAGTSVAFGRGHALLQATDTLYPDEDYGLDTPTIALLYKVELLDRGDLEPAAVRKLMVVVAKVPVLLFEPQAPAGIDLCGPHVWSVVFHSIGCPYALSSVRNVRFKIGEKVEEVHIHHPRAAHRHPCPLCLNTMHSKKECKSHEPEVSTNKHTSKVTLDERAAPPVLKLAPSAKACGRNPKKLHKTTPPELTNRFHAEKEAEKLKEVKAATKKIVTTVARLEKILTGQRCRKSIWSKGHDQLGGLWNKESLGFKTYIIAPLSLHLFTIR